MVRDRFGGPLWECLNRRLNRQGTRKYTIEEACVPLRDITMRAPPWTFSCSGDSILSLANDFIAFTDCHSMPKGSCSAVAYGDFLLFGHVLFIFHVEIESRELESKGGK